MSYGFQDPHMKIGVSILLAQAGQADEAKRNLVAVIGADPRAADAIYSVAVIDEQIKNLNEAIIYRKKLEALDPWNYKNLLQLGEDLKATGDTAGAKAIIGKIDAFASKTAEAVTAHKDFGSL
jgi:tetratricopeptide (TPR) repeat protein